MVAAKQSYGRAIKQAGETGDTQTAAFAAYELGLLLCRDPQVRDVQYLFSMARSYPTSQKSDFGGMFAIWNAFTFGKKTVEHLD